MKTGNDSGFREGSEGRLEFDNVQLWQPLKAYLYTLKVELVNSGQTVDVYEELFGVRKVEVKNGKFYINGKPFYFKGFGKHEDSPIHGRGFAEAVNVMDFNLMKWIGANSFRTSHYPYSEEMMRLAIEKASSSSMKHLLSACTLISMHGEDARDGKVLGRE